MREFFPADFNTIFLYPRLWRESGSALRVSLLTSSSQVCNSSCTDLCRGAHHLDVRVDQLAGHHCYRALERILFPPTTPIQDLSSFPSLSCAFSHYLSHYGLPEVAATSPQGYLRPVHLHVELVRPTVWDHPLQHLARRVHLLPHIASRRAAVCLHSCR